MFILRYHFHAVVLNILQGEVQKLLYGFYTLFFSLFFSYLIINPPDLLCDDDYVDLSYILLLILLHSTTK